MTEKKVSDKQMSKQAHSQLLDKNDSLLAQGKGIWPLIIATFILGIYMLVSLILLLISYKFGRLR